MNSAKCFFAALAAVSLLAYADDSPGPSASERLKTARTAIAANNWSKAMFELDKAERDEPRNPEIQNLLGYTYRKQPKPDLRKAFEHYNMALKLDPNHKGTHEYIGEAYLMDKKPAEAEKHLMALEKICGNKSCEEYTDLAKSIADYKLKN